MFPVMMAPQWPSLSDLLVLGDPDRSVSISSSEGKGRKRVRGDIGTDKYEALCFIRMALRF